jgi:hypothetical protein
MTSKDNITFITKLNWQNEKSKLKEQFPHLTEPDWNFKEVKVNEINNMLSKIGRPNDGLIGYFGEK